MNAAAMTALRMTAWEPADFRPWRDARRVLAVRLDNMGDVLMTTPALQAIRGSAPDMHLTLLASPSGAALERYMPCVDEVIRYEAPWVKGVQKGGALDRRLISRLRREAFDAAVIFTVCTQSALPSAMLCRLADIPLRLAHSRENPYGLLTDWVQDTDVCETGMRHEVRRQLDLVRSVGFAAAGEGLVFEPAPSDVLRMRRKLAAAGGDPARPFFVVHPGATAASRRYPAERFGMAADTICRATACQAVFMGGHDERPLVEQARSHMQGDAVSLAGQLTLGELGALIGQARLTLCNNSGPAHLSAALGTPVVVLYALTNPQHTPWRVSSRVLNHDVPCRNCLKSVCPAGHHDCLMKVPAGAVADAALELLDAAPKVQARAGVPDQVPLFTYAA